MTDKNIFDIYGGLDTRESYGNESSILSYTEAKNIDIDGKVVRRARGQTQVSIAPSGSTWAGIAPAPGGFIGGINEDGKYYRTDPVTLISTPVYSGIINMPLEVPTNLSGMYDENSGTINLTWTNGNGTDVTIEIWLKIDDGEYALLETGLSDWLGGDIPTGVTHDVSPLGYGTFYYRLKASNNLGASDFSDETSIEITIPVPQNFSLDDYDYNSDTSLYDWSFSWNYNATATSFKLYRKTGAGSYSLVKTIDGSLREDVYNFAPSAGNTYTFKITAIVDGVETGASSEVIRAISSLDLVIGAPTLILNSPYTQISWSNMSNELGYEVYSQTNDVGDWTLAHSTGASETSWNFPQPPGGTKVSYKVRAFNNAKGIFSTPKYVNGTPLAPLDFSLPITWDGTKYHGTWLFTPYPNTIVQGQGRIAPNNYDSNWYAITSPHEFSFSPSYDYRYSRVRTVASGRIYNNGSIYSEPSQEIGYTTYPP